MRAHGDKSTGLVDIDVERWMRTWFVLAEIKERKKGARHDQKRM